MLKRLRIKYCEKIKTSEMEIALACYFGGKRGKRGKMNVIVPNVSYGMFDYELDLFMISHSGYGIEIEIKVDKYDLINDKKKKHEHRNFKIKYLYFAIPEYLLKYQEHIPEDAGIISVRKFKGVSCNIIRKPKIRNRYEFSDLEKFKAIRLAALRIWKLKRKVLEQEIKILKLKEMYNG